MPYSARWSVLLLLSGWWLCAAGEPQAQKVEPAGKAAAAPAVFTPPPIQVPPGYTVELVAGAPLVKYPLMAAFDDRGRLFIAESDGQNLGKDLLLKHKPRFVRMLEDVDSDGKFDKSTIFADQMVMPEGAQWHNGSFYIMSAPYLWKMDDTDGDGVADRRESLVGEMDLIGNANQHGPYVAPDGRMFFSGGTFGYNLTGKDGKHAGKGNWASVFSCTAEGNDVRVECHSGINPVEVIFTEEGEMLGTCAIFDRVGGRCDSLVHWVHGASYAERQRVPTLKQTGHYLPAAKRWGQVAPAGLVRYRGTQFGADCRDNLFACRFNTHDVVRMKLEREGATWRATDEVFLTSPSIDFHPADILEDADGSLLLLDTGGWLTMGCPTSKIGKPEVFGGIYRIRKTKGDVPADPRGLKLNWTAETDAMELAGRLADPRPAARDRAIEALAQRGDKVVPTLAKLSQPPNSTALRRDSVWTLARIGTPAARSLIVQSLADSDPTVRQAAAHSLGTLREAGAVETLMKLVVADELPIRREAATALGLIGNPQAVPALFASLQSARDEFLVHALIYALIEIGHPAATRPGLGDINPQVQRAALVALDQMEGGELTRAEVAPLLAASDADLHRAALEVIGRHTNWGDEIVKLLGEALQVREATLTHHALIAGAVPAFAKNDKVQSVVAESLSSTALPAVRLTLLEAIAKADLTQLPSGWIAPLAKLCQDPDERVRRQVVVTVGAFNTEPFVTPLLALARDTTQPNSLRVAALAAVARRDTELADADLRLLIDQVQADVAPIDRLAAADALGRASLSGKQLALLPALIEKAGPLELPALLRAMENGARSPRVKKEELRDPGLRFMDALAKSPGLTALSAARVQTVADLYPDEVALALKRVLPKLAASNEEQRQRIAEIESQIVKGDAERGRQIFISNRAACAVCHRVAAQGGQIGPDLSRIGQVRTTRDLAEAILFPSATLANGYESYTVATHAGRIQTGLIRRESADAIHLITTDRAEVRIPRAEIEELKPSTTSVMPQGLDRLLTAEELLHVVAFLKTLK